MRVLTLPLVAGLIAGWINLALERLTDADVFEGTSGETKGVFLAQDTKNRSVFFRFVALYEHMGEQISIDIMVGCAVRVTSYLDGDTSYDSFRYPAVFAVSTRDGGAIWQPTPHACRGETTDSGQVPEDFLPGAVWFSDRRDFSLGIGYFTEEAFSKPDAELRFLGSRIERATRDDWEASQDVLAKNLIDPKPFSIVPKWPSEEDVRNNLWNKQKLTEWWRSSFACHGVQRYHISDSESRAVLARYWPDGKPRFWHLVGNEQEQLVRELSLTNGGKGPLVDGKPEKSYFWFGQAGGGGFPTEKGGGRLNGSGQLPATVFPLRADEGLPWVTPSVAASDILYRDIELTDQAKGILYCYSILHGRGYAGEAHLPNWFDREFRTRVNGTLIDQSDVLTPERVPSIFFENDEYYFRSFSFNWG